MLAPQRKNHPKNEMRALPLYLQRSLIHRELHKGEKLGGYLRTGNCKLHATGFIGDYIRRLRSDIFRVIRSFPAAVSSMIASDTIGSNHVEYSS